MKRETTKRHGSIRLTPSPAELTSVDTTAFSPSLDERNRLLHDLQVHQVELESQNRELRESHHLLELSRDRYADLYDFAPVGYVTLDKKGLIREINLTAAGMLGVDRARLIGSPFGLYVAKDDLPAFGKHLGKLPHSDERATTELGLSVKGGGVIQVELQSVLVLDEERKTSLCRTMIADITARKRAESALAESERRYRLMFEESPLPMWVLETATLTFLAVNEAAVKHYGFSREEFLSMTLKQIDVIEGIPKVPDYLLARPANCPPADFRRHRKKNGTLIDVEVVSHALVFDAHPSRLVLCHDVTEQRRAEEALRQSEANLARAQAIAHLGSYEINVQGSGMVRWSAETFRILGLDPAKGELSTEEYLNCVVHPEDQTLVRESTDRAMKEGTRHDLEYRIVRPDSSIRHVHSIAEPVLGADNKVARLPGTFQDVTERKQLEKGILEISEREQSRIGQDLHDGLCPHLAGIEFRMKSLEQRLALKSKKESREAAELAKLVQRAIEQTRTLAHGLSPVMLAPDGLMNGLQELAAGTEKAFKISCAFNCPSPLLIHDNAVATHLYRIAHEAVHNAIRHGKPKFVVINLLSANDRIILAVKDDGAGFPTKPQPHQGMGLRVMQYRAGIVGGSLVVQRHPEGGASIVCSLRAPKVENCTE
ncbi:MAG: PAS domain S-box protein [Verrucomicrobiota bacterium]